jgi:hypothetical protein
VFLPRRDKAQKLTEVIDIRELISGKEEKGKNVWKGSGLAWANGCILIIRVLLVWPQRPV